MIIEDKMTRLLLASANPGKLREIKDLLKDLPVELVTPQEIGLDLQIEEHGSTYAENAALKALAYARASGMLTLADDSGLEVDALEGRPGIYSARFSPQPGASDADRRAYLLQCLEGLARPWRGRFRCVVALATPQGQVYFSEGICEGEVIPEERGQDGFGYDPIFLIPELGLTMAELDLPSKNRLSHRARAIRAAIPMLTELIRSIR
jgi:XTP/dITP diphosphohydrolase